MEIRFNKLETKSSTINVKFSEEVSRDYEVEKAKLNGIEIDPDDCADLDDISIVGKKESHKPKEINNFNDAFKAMPRTVTVAIEQLPEYLKSLDKNTPESPYVLNIVGLTQEHFNHGYNSSTNSCYLSQIIENGGKYIILNEKPGSCTATKFDRSAFYLCNHIIGLKGDFSNVTSIGHSTFQFCSNLTTMVIPKSVTSIDNNAFYKCTSLASIEIPNGVTTISNCAFGSCESLTSVTIPNSVTYIDSSAFNSCTSLTSVIIPNNVTYLSGFDDCTSLTSIDIPNSVTSISEGAFWNCISLTSIVIPDSVTLIGIYAFRGCTSLASINIPNSVTYIGEYAFYGCNNLTSIEIGNSVTKIDSNAFNGCTRLTSITIPNSVTSISYHAFGNCSSLITINYTGTQKQWNSINKGSYWNYNVPSSCVINFNYSA